MTAVKALIFGNILYSIVWPLCSIKEIACWICSSLYSSTFTALPEEDVLTSTCGSPL
jgi:hypothetical protein